MLKTADTGEPGARRAFLCMLLKCEHKSIIDPSSSRAKFCADCGMVFYKEPYWNTQELQAVNEFAKRSLPKLRQIQSCIEQQTILAYEQKKDDALWRLERLALIVAAAIDKKAFL